jgi:hypothetical protein
MSGNSEPTGWKKNVKLPSLLFVNVGPAFHVHRSFGFQKKLKLRPQFHSPLIPFDRCPLMPVL